MPVQLFSHNMQAYEAAKAMLDRASKAVVIHPTSTGNSFISFKWIEEHPEKRFVWLSPSDYIFSVQKDSPLRFGLPRGLDHIRDLFAPRVDDG